MESINRERIYRWHVLFWLFFIGYKIVFENIRVTDGTDSVDTFFVFLVHIANFYYVTFCLKTWNKRNVFLSFLLLLAGYFAYIFFFRLYCKVLIQSIGHGLYYIHQTWKDLFIDGTDLYFQFFFYAFGFWFISRNYKIQESLNRSEVENAQLAANNLYLQNRSLKLENENLQLQHQNLQSEHNYLKAQVNPHFLYNTLSFFYTETELVRPNVAKGIELLIDIMRYSLHRETTGGNVPLEQELEHLNKFIELLKLRFGKTFSIDYSTSIEGCSGWRIPPHILITLAENAIKHGITTEKENPVIIRLFCNNCELHFSVDNKIDPAKSQYSSMGMGLKNLEKRLALEYKDLALLNCENKNGIFQASLKIVQQATPKE